MGVSELSEAPVGWEWASWSGHWVPRQACHGALEKAGRWAWAALKGGAPEAQAQPRMQTPEGENPPNSEQQDHSPLQELGRGPGPAPWVVGGQLSQRPAPPPVPASPPLRSLPPRGPQKCWFRSNLFWAGLAVGLDSSFSFCSASSDAGDASPSPAQPSRLPCATSAPGLRSPESRPQSPAPTTHTCTSTPARAQTWGHTETHRDTLEHAQTHRHRDKQTHARTHARTSGAGLDLWLGQGRWPYAGYRSPPVRLFCFGCPLCPLWLSYPLFTHRPLSKEPSPRRPTGGSPRPTPQAPVRQASGAAGSAALGASVCCIVVP